MFNNPAVRAFLTGLGITVALQVGAALASIGSIEDLEQWGRTALISTVSAVGAFVVNWFQAKQGV